MAQTTTRRTEEVPGSRTTTEGSRRTRQTPITREQARQSEHETISREEAESRGIDTSILDEDRPFSERATGITGPGGGTTMAGTGQDVVSTEEQRARDQLAGEEEDKARADDLATSVQGDIDDIKESIDDALAAGDEERARFLTELRDTKEEVQGIPTEITNEFERLRAEFGAEADASFDRIDTQREEALADAEQGRSAAMQAAVQGIQGNVNTQVAQIMANPNLTQAQKQSMVAQTRLAGASSLAPAIGANILAFNQLSADIATKFGTITGNLESTIISAKGELVGLQGTAFSNAQIAVGQISAQLLDIDASASASYATSQSQLLATRSHAVMTGNDTLLRVLPEQSTPYLDLTGAAVAAYTIGSDIIKTNLSMALQESSWEATLAMVKSQIGNPISNLIEGLVGGFAMGGPTGAVFGGLGGLLGS